MVAAAGFEKKNRQTENFPPPFTRHSSLPCLCIIIAFTRFVCSNHTICTRCGIIINSRHEYMYIVYILYYSISRICVFTAEYIHIYCIYLYLLFHSSSSIVICVPTYKSIIFACVHYAITVVVLLLKNCYNHNKHIVIVEHSRLKNKSIHYVP